VARRQYGVIALHQLVGLGLSPSAVRGRVAAGRLWRMHRGVYAVGHLALAPRGHAIAAVLACGPGAALSHRSCAALRGLRRSARTRIDVTAPGRRGRSIAGIDAHRDDTLHPDDVEDVDGIPCTTVARTLLDLAGVVDRRALERACEQAEVLEVFDLRAIDDVLRRANGRRGAGVLRAVLREHTITPLFTRRELEERFLRLCRDHALEAPEVNSWIALEGGGLEADFVWRGRRLCVETDGRAVHLTRHAFERDRRRDQRLLLAGWRVARFTWRQLEDEPATVAATLRGLLAQAAV
jgi:very-short-patch-repair endonuclease